MEDSYITADADIEPTSILRRYLDLAKLLDLLHSKSLYFRRADGFSDRLEGALFPCLRQLMNEEFKKGNIPADANQFYRYAREGNFVNCWTIGAHDNMALWKLYGGVNSSVAVTTTVERIVNCASEWGRPIHLYKVKYVDHKRPPNYAVGIYRDVLQFKSNAYSYENELRVVVPQDQNIEENPMGIKLKVHDINTLVRSIVVAPEADLSFVDAVRDLCHKYGLTAPVRRSKLAFVPT